MANSTGSRAPINGAHLAGNAWRYATPGMTTTTTSALNGGNGTAGDFVKAGMLAKFGKQAIDNYLAAKAAQDLGGAIANAGSGGAVTSGLTGGSAAALGEIGGQLGIQGNEAIMDAVKSGLWAPPGEAAQVIGGTAAAPLEGSIGLANGGAGQAVGDAAAGMYSDIVGQAANQAADAAETGLLSQAAGYAPIVGTALNIGANLAQGNYGAAGGAATGAALGSIIPGVGTALGGTIGGLLGSFIR